jgi:hypothetical protein
MSIDAAIDPLVPSRYRMLEFVNIKLFRFYDQLVHNGYVESNNSEDYRNWIYNI